MKSVRLVVCECRITAPTPNDDDKASSSEDLLWNTLEANLPSRLPWKIYESFGNTLPTTTNIIANRTTNTNAAIRTKGNNEKEEEETLSSKRRKPQPEASPPQQTTQPRLNVSCRRWASFGALSRDEFSSTRTKAVLRQLLLQKYKHQYKHKHDADQNQNNPDDRDQNKQGDQHQHPPLLLPDCEFTLLLYGGGGDDDGNDNGNGNGMMRLEWTMLVPPKAKKFSDMDYLPKPGCKRVEAWMLMRNLQDLVLREVSKRKTTTTTSSGEHKRSSSSNNNSNNGNEVVVLDPLCGKATFLVEGATTWNLEDQQSPLTAGENASNDHDKDNDRVSISFVGIDASEAQLEDASRNVEAVADALGTTNNGNGTSSKSNSKGGTRRTCGSTISLYQGDSRNLSRLGFEDGSVTAIATCPPFGRQFFALENDKAVENNSAGSTNNANDTKKENVDNDNDNEKALATSYKEWLHEWTRVLDPNNGRIALLVDVDHQKEALAAIHATNSLRVTVLRDPFRLGRLRATVIVADVDVNADASSSLEVVTEGTIHTSSAPLTRFPWEGTAKLARAEWTRLRTASLQELVPYTSSSSSKL